jgi:hypothetical protein
LISTAELLIAWLLLLVTTQRRQCGEHQQEQELDYPADNHICFFSASSLCVCGGKDPAFGGTISANVISLIKYAMFLPVLIAY